ncbi:MAG: FAD-dependent oxidoreductase [Pigmentiphaga sp.]|uniref:FAD-dependent oxidoreductase n=1 Tax=Pigmentiphaga sp. TaxID=1977564 RepID=UPI0029A51B60|nr:FAD-dependent oxidoreductase [Pigmentiphaga sp.]MDX3905735.1 FAD-dependent oxidoreductase [Pigmentiphaga sp.]
MPSLDHGAERPPIVARYDVLVAGGGASGLVAAASAARAGARVAVVERAGCLGGTATASMVAQWLGFFNRDTRVVGGLPLELTERVCQAGGSEGFRRYTLGEALKNPLPLVNFPFNPEIVKIVADELLADAGVDVLLHTQVAEPVMEAGRVRGLVIQNVSGRSAVAAETLIDATGDAAVAHACGVACADPDFDRHGRQPCTLVFRLSNIDVRRFRAVPRDEKRALALEGVRRGDLPWESLSFCSTPGDTDAISLMSRIHGIDALDGTEASRAMAVGRQQIKRILPFLRANVPGFERAVLSGIAEQLGVRETRRIVGRYTLRAEDIRGRVRFDDSIALGAGPVDVHDEKGTGVSLWMPDGPFEIPLRTMLPTDVHGLVVTGRAISATREANGGARHMATAMALGEAAGVCAALVAKGRDLADIAADVRAALRSRGALVAAEDVARVAQPEPESIPAI